LCVAVQGCCHGELDAIYDRLKRHEESSGQKVDLLLCCGDFQSLRNTADYHSFAVPPKYRSLGSFHKYYSGEKEAPILTIFVGGNHEASQSLHELYYGGWVAPNIYYLGAAGVVNLAGVRIGGVSGIYKSHDYTQGRFERPPYDRSSLRSVYHVRNTDVYRLKCLDPENRIDIFLSHDWPQGIEQHGDTNQLLLEKPFFREEVQRNDLGSLANRELLDSLKPKWWFSGHLHVKFKAQVNYSSSGTDAVRGSSNVANLVPSQVNQTSADPDKIDVDNDEEVVEPCAAREAAACETSKGDDSAVTTQFQSMPSSKACNEHDLTDMMTRFLALDKCLPRRNHLSILHVPCHGRRDILEYDPEWLAVLQKTHRISSAEKRRVRCPRDLVPVSKEEIEAIKTTLTERSQDKETPLAIPRNFVQTVPPEEANSSTGPLPMMGNPQTDNILNILGLEHVITIPYSNLSANRGHTSMPSHEDANEIDLDEVEGQPGDIVIDFVGPSVAAPSPAQALTVDDDEIDLDDADNDESGDAKSSDPEPSRMAKKARANS
jgi:lariat debranching enzyme